MTISAEELKQIQKEFNEIIEFSQEADYKINTEQLFKDWYAGKERYIEKFGGKLIYEYPVQLTFSTSKENLKSKVNEINSFYSLLNELRNAAEFNTKYEYNDLYLFINHNNEGIILNQVINDYKYKDKTIPKGMKIIKAFRYFISNKKDLKILQAEAQKIVQPGTITGKLCISVDPRDFLSLSENTYKWETCQSLTGDYRAGNLSYMIDNSTVITYLKGDDDKILPNFPDEVPWNSKKWRMLLFFSEDLETLFFGRQYPCDSEECVNFIKNSLLKEVNLLNNFETEQIAISDNANKIRLVKINDEIVPLNEIVKDNPNSNHYNDVLMGRLKHNIPTYSKMNNKKKYPKVRIGGKVLCTRCGKSPIEFSETMLCTECELKYGHSNSDVFAYCQYCDSKYVDEDGYFLEREDISICPKCMKLYTIRCDCCDEFVLEENIHYDEEKGIYICRYCREED